MKKFNIIAVKARTGERRTLGTVEAATEKEARKQAIINYLSSINMIFEHFVIELAA